MKKFITGVMTAVFGITMLSGNVTSMAIENKASNETETPTEYSETVRTGRTAPYYNLSTNGGSWNGSRYILKDTLITDAFFCDGTYTYYLQADGSPMKDRLTYHPDGEHLIYFDGNGHELFDTFQFCKDVGYTCYFDTYGYIYKDKITFNAKGDAYYLNNTGKLEDAGWFTFYNGIDFGYAASDGKLKNDGFGYDNQNRIVYYHWNGVVARGLISDGVYFYSMNIYDGHYEGGFKDSSVYRAPNYELVDGINQYRMAKNLLPYRIDDKLMQAAQTRATELSETFSSSRPDGKAYYTTYKEAGASYYWAGENRGRGQLSANSIIMDSLTILNPNMYDTDFQYVGAAYYYAGDAYGYYWALEFGGYNN